MPNNGDSKPQMAGRNGVIRHADADAIKEAGAFIRDGALVAFPTETVYGLGADATNGGAIARIFAAKGRPSFNPLIVHVLGLEQAESIGHFSPLDKMLAAQFWPGPLTLVVKRRAATPIAELVTSGLPTIAIRVPKNSVARALLKAAQRPLAAPSANRSGHVSATVAAHVAADLGDKVAMILDGGSAQHGLESTIVRASADDLELLRPGAISIDQLKAAAGVNIRLYEGHQHAPTSPGQLDSHYAPRAAIRLNALDVRPGEALLGFGCNMPPSSGARFNLSPTGDVVEAAANLFSALRILDAGGIATIAVMPIPNMGLGEAINDRLRRAAAPRPKHQ